MRLIPCGGQERVRVCRGPRPGESDLNEDQRIPFPFNKIQLAGAGCHAVIAIHHDDSGPLQEARYDVLTTAAEGPILRQVLLLAPVMPEQVREFV
jgi:hypothetical protein